MNTAALHIAHIMAGVPSVSLAGLGTFERLAEPAVYNPETHVITPPRVSICFDYNPRVATGEELIQSVIAAEGCTRQAAESELAQCALMIVEDLRHRGSFAIPGLGVLTGTPECAVLDRDRDFVDAYAACWLAPLELTPIFEQAYTLETPPPIDEEDEEETPPPLPVEPDDEEPPVRRNVFRRHLRVASSWAAAVLIFGVVALVTALVNRYDDGDVYVGANTMAVSPAVHALAAESEPNAPLLLVFRTPADGEDESRVRPETPEAQEEAAAEAASRPSDSAPEGSFCLIVASLANSAEAASYIAENTTPEIPLYLLETQGRFRIYAAAGENPADVLAQARQTGLCDRYPNAWVCRR